MEQTLTPEQPDLLLEEEASLNLQRATTGQRLTNYLIDLFTVIILVVLMYFILYNSSTEEPSSLFERIITYLILIAYYTFFEFFTKGKTLGKLITGTRAVREDGSNISFSNALVRSICRIIPFEPLSGFNAYPWHDKWTKTIVVKNKN